jgi:hypothetical protein
VPASYPGDGIDVLTSALQPARAPRRADPAVRTERADELIDETLLETFPASDPPSWWAGPPS